MKTGVGNEEQSERSVVAERISVDGRHQSQGVAELTSKRILVLFQLSHSLYATHRRQQTTHNGDPRARAPLYTYTTVATSSASSPSSSSSSIIISTAPEERTRITTVYS